MEKLTEKEMSPLSSLDVWEDDVLSRYPEPGTAKAKDEFRVYNDAEDNPVREFYRLNHTHQTYGNVLAK
ncbi:MAG TPA: inositol oxygenase, partial [Mucilaginibacter sp.]